MKKKEECAAQDILSATLVAILSFTTMTTLVLEELPTVSGSRVPMKVVDEPSSFGFQPQQDFGAQQTLLKVRVHPSNFSGPEHLRILHGKCFSKIDNNYKYEVCPFFNVTQHEQSLRWNPFSGILGVWQEWEIKGYKFEAMEMREGDSCGSDFRTVKVILLCGEKDEVGTISEPSTCHYHVEFKTPLVCHPHSLLVYPTLTDKQRHKWDVIETQLANEEITEKGYNISVHALFEEVGLVLSKSAKQQLHDTAKQESKPASQNEPQFYSLPQCSQEYEKLRKEFETMKSQFELQESMKNGTVKDNSTEIPMKEKTS